MTTDIPDWIAEAHRDNGKRFVVHADEKLTAFLELESAIREATVYLARCDSLNRVCIRRRKRRINLH